MKFNGLRVVASRLVDAMRMQGLQLPPLPPPTCRPLTRTIPPSDATGPEIDSRRIRCSKYMHLCGGLDSSGLGSGDPFWHARGARFGQFCHRLIKFTGVPARIEGTVAYQHANFHIIPAVAGTFC